MFMREFLSCHQLDRWPRFAVATAFMLSGRTHFPMGGGNYLRRSGLLLVQLILSAVLLGGAVSQEGGGGSGKEEGDSFCVGEGEVESGGGVSGWSELGWGGFLILADEK